MAWYLIKHKDNFKLMVSMSWKQASNFMVLRVAWPYPLLSCSSAIIKFGASKFVCRACCGPAKEIVHCASVQAVSQSINQSGVAETFVFVSILFVHIKFMLETCVFIRIHSFQNILELHVWKFETLRYNLHMWCYKFLKVSITNYLKVKFYPLDDSIAHIIRPYKQTSCKWNEGIQNRHV